jgi:hypothetical protein
MARHSGKVLDIQGAGQHNLANLTQWSLHGGRNQQFRLHRNKNGFWSIRAVHSGKCLDVHGGDHKNGANVMQVINIF